LYSLIFISLTLLFENLGYPETFNPEIDPLIVIKEIQSKNANSMFFLFKCKNHIHAKKKNAFSIIKFA